MDLIAIKLRVMKVHFELKANLRRPILLLPMIAYCVLSLVILLLSAHIAGPGSIITRLSFAVFSLGLLSLAFTATFSWGIVQSGEDYVDP